MDDGVQEQTISFFIATRLITAVNSISKIDSAPIAWSWRGRRPVRIDTDSNRVVDRGNNDSRIRYSEQLERPATAIHANCRTTSADASSAHLDDSACVDHDRYVLWNVKSRSVCQRRTEAVESNFIRPIRGVAKNPQCNGAISGRIGP